MKVLLINGSPKGKRSNTYRLACSFLDGMKPAEVRECAASQMEIRPCLGCFSCWNKTPGQCCIRDDMSSVLENLLWADVVVWSFPLYYFGVPGSLKNLIDRQLPLSLPFMSRDSRSGGHPSRYDMSGKRHVVISTCGFYTPEGNYDGVMATFDHMLGKGKYETVFCGQGELFRVKELNQRTGEYLADVKKAGEEFVHGGISRETREKLANLLYPRAVFEAMADASWGVEPEGQKTDESLTFTRQMAALYNPASYSGKDRVLEMYYTDLDKRYQIRMTREGSTVLTENFQDYTTRIETPYTLWKSIAAGEISGEEALAAQRYRVKGDFDLMIHWDKYFGQEQLQTAVSDSRECTNMNILLIPWIGFWVAAAIHSFYGALISILICAVVPLLYEKNRKTRYDHLSGLLVTACGAALLLGAPVRVIVPISYLAFGLMWSLSCLTAIPLTAHYSMNDYNGEEAWKNPLFMKTNRILTACWGVLYLITPVWTYFLMGTEAASWTGAINSILPMAMGVFTGWFQKWYPAKIARGKEEI